MAVYKGHKSHGPTGQLTAFGIAMTYVGAVIGAGFASGKELYEFFATFGPRGLLGIGVSGVLFALLGVLSLSVQMNTISVGSRLVKDHGFESFLRCALGPAIGRIADVLVTASLYISLVVMLSGSGMLAEQLLGLPVWFGCLFTAAAASTVVLAGAKGVTGANSVLVPMLVVVASAVALFVMAGSIGGAVFPPAAPVVWEGPETLKTSATAALQTWGFPIEVLGDGAETALVPRSWLWAAFLYVSYNYTIALAVFGSLDPSDLSPRMSLAAGVLAGCALALVGGLLTAALLVGGSDLAGAPAPILRLAAAISPLLGTVYGGVLWIAMFTTAVCDVYALGRRLSAAFGICGGAAGVLILGLALPPSSLGFSALVTTVYPATGILGLPLVVAVAAAGAKMAAARAEAPVQRNPLALLRTAAARWRTGSILCPRNRR